MSIVATHVEVAGLQPAPVCVQYTCVLLLTDLTWIAALYPFTSRFWRRQNYDCSAVPPAGRGLR